MRKLTFYVLVACLLSSPATAARAVAKQQLAVLDLRADVEMDEGMQRTLNELILNEFHSSGLYVALGMSDIASMLSNEAQNQMLTGCSDDSCLAEIGGAFGVQLVAFSSVGAVGDAFVVSLKIINTDQATVLARWSEVVPRDDSKLLAAVRSAVAHVTRPDAPKAAVGAEAAPAAPPSATRLWPWLTAGLAGASMAAAGVAGILATQKASAARDAVYGTPTWQDNRDSAKTYATTTDVLLGVGVATAVVSAVLFLIEPDAPATALTANGGGTASGALQWRF